ncbi:SRPBCC family protein [Streptomyces sp. NPDC002574]|uniref:SRPBCC family protein n=1 Tax=Streptomyces sp. NPDC002574 TaxID=3364652 RepID=UPI0036C02EE5
MSRLEEQIDLGVPSEVAWKHLHDVGEYPQFVGGVLDATAEGESRARLEVARGGGDDASIGTEISDRPQARGATREMTWRTSGTPEISGTCSVLPIDEQHSRVQVRMEYDAGEVREAFGGPKGFAQVSAIERTVRDDLRRFKDLVERER